RIVFVIAAGNREAEQRQHPPAPGARLHARGPDLGCRATAQRIRAPWRTSSCWTARMSSRSNDAPERNETAAATPAPCPLTAQHIMLRTAACEIRSPPIERPATSRLPTPLGTSARYGTWK